MLIPARRTTRRPILALTLAISVLVSLTLVLTPSRAGAQPPPSVVWITPLGLDLGTAAVGVASGTQDVTVTNVSGQEMEVSVGTPTSPFTSTTTCGATLAAGASCTVTYQFTPDAAGPLTGSATIETTAGGTTEGNTLALLGIGLATAGDPADRLVVTPRDLDFGPLDEGETSPAQVVTVTNTTDTLAGGIAAGEPDDDAFAVSGTCPDPLAVDASCTFSYTYTAPASGPVDATSAITVPGGTVDIDLAGRTTGPAGPVGDDGYFVIEQDGDLYAFGSGARALLRSIDPAAVDNDAKQTTVSKVVGPQLAGATAVAIELTADLRGLWILDSKGVVHELGNAPDAQGVAPSVLTKTVDGQPEAPAALARVGVDDLWVFSNAGRVIPQFGTLNAAAEAAMDLVLSKDLWGGINDAKPTVDGTGAYALGSDGGVFAYNAPFLGNPYTGIAERLGVPVGSVGPDLPVSGITVDPDATGYWVVAEDGGVFAFEAPFVGSLPAIIPFEDLFAPVNGMVPYGNGYLLVAGDGGVFNFSNLPFEGSASGLADTTVSGIAAL